MDTYKVLSTPTHGGLTTEVTDALRSGWSLVGGLQVAAIGGGRAVYSQAVTRQRTEKEKERDHDMSHLDILPAALGEFRANKASRRHIGALIRVCWRIVKKYPEEHITLPELTKEEESAAHNYHEEAYR